jgi:hypothetical protein
MTKDQYLRMVEQTGQEIEWDRVPPDTEDFPRSVINALNIFHSLGNRMYPDIGYVGKDFTTLNILMDLYDVKLKVEKEWLYDLLLFLDSRQITESQKRLKAEHDKIKNKQHG